MGSSENTLQNIRMFVTDADGTLLGHQPEFGMCRAFRNKMDERTLHTTLIVLAWFGLIPFADAITKPYRSLVELLAHFFRS